MKKLLATVLCAVSLFCLVPLSGCQSSGSGPQPFTIVTSFYPMYLFAQNIANGIAGVKVVNMTQPQTGCLHDYQLSAYDMKTLSRASVFIVNGAGMETFLGDVSSQIPGIKIITASEGIRLLKSETDETEYNPHVWVSITDAQAEVKNIAEGLILADPAHKEQYRRNEQGYLAALEKEKQNMHEQLKNCRTKDIVTFHEAFPYFAQEFGLNIAAVLEVDPGSEPSAAQLKNIIAAVKQKKLRVLFTEPQYTPEAATTVSLETGAKIYQLDPIVTGPMDDPGYYVEVMDKNLTVLKKALS